MTRRLAAVAILCAWMVSIAVLTRRQMDPAANALAGLDERLPPGGAFLRIVVAGRQVGIFSTVLDTTSTGVRAFERLDVAAPARKGARRITLGTELRFDWALDLLALRLTRGGEGPRVRAAVTLDSAARAYGIQWLLGGDTASTRSAQPTGQAVGTVASALRLVGLRPEAIADRPRRLLLDPLTMDWADADIRLGEEVTLAVPDSAALGPDDTWVEARWDTVAVRQFRMRLWGLPFTGFVDVDGNLVSMSTPLGATWERNAFEIVRAGYEPDAAGDPATWSGPRAAGERPAGVGRRGFRAVLRRLDGQSLGDLTDLVGPGQVVSGDTIGVSAVSVAQARGGEPELVTTAWNRGSPAHPAEDPRIQALARRILQGGTDPASRATALVRWVQGEVTLDPSGPDHPLAALQHHRASPRGKVALLVTLARAAGISARPVAGLRLTGDGFEPWGWAELAVPGWLPVDPVLGRVPPPADRIRLAVGVPADPLVLLPLFGGVEAVLLPSTTRP